MVFIRATKDEFVFVILFLGFLRLPLPNSAENVVSSETDLPPSNDVILGDMVGEFIGVAVEFVAFASVVFMVMERECVKLGSRVELTSVAEVEIDCECP